MFPAPPAPEFPPDQAATSEASLRYEDCAQDGRMIPISLPPTMGGLWRSVITKHPGARNSVASGVIPILTRMTLISFDQPIRIDRPIETRSGFLLAHDLEAGAVSRLFMNVWTDVHGIAGRIGPRQVEGALSRAGTLFAEHTFTRLFAPPDQRKVTELEVEGYPVLPPTRYASPPPKTAQEAPEGATWLDELAPDTVDTVFTFDQTDANQHVNSLVYIRTFLDAAQRRIAATGRSMKLRSKAVDIAYRKPCFAGDRVTSQLRLFSLGDSIGAAGLMVGEDGKPRCYVRVIFGP
jgi:acyl-CoA thioesterase FadM